MTHSSHHDDGTAEDSRNPPPAASGPGHGGAPRDGSLRDDDPELRWLRETYRGDEPQLTGRALLTGMLLGGVMSLSNLYVSLHTGWSFGVTITAGILAFVLFQGLSRLGVAKRDFGLLENNAMQSVASAAGYMTGGGTVAVIPGLMLLTGAPVPGYQIFIWITAIAFLGVFLAIPMKRQLINREGVRFPSGIAAAETLRSLHGHARDPREIGGGEPEGQKQASALVRAGVFAATWTWLRDANLPALSMLALPKSLSPGILVRGVPLAKWTVAFDTSLLLFAAGGIMGFRPAWSLMLGAVVNYGWLAPHGLDIGVIPADQVAYKSIIQYTLWFGSSVLLTAGIVQFAFAGPQIARALRSVTATRSTERAKVDPLAEIEVPTRWFVLGALVVSPVIVIAAVAFFGMAWWEASAFVLLSFFLASIAARATGETDITPSSALGKVTQLVAGGIAPGSVTTNLMSASISTGVGLHAADLLTDLKSGFLLGAKPRQQFFAQFFGVLAGSAFIVPAIRLLVPDASVVGSAQVPAPAAVSWTAVAQVLSGGLGSLPEATHPLILVGGALGVVLSVAERLVPRAKAFIPSPVGFGLAFTLPASHSISMFLGALVVFVLERRRKTLAARYVIPVCSGIIAGESLIGILIAALVVFGVLAH